MKVITVLLLVMVASISNAQMEASLKKEFFNMENVKVALALGADISWAGDTGNTGMIQPNGNITENQIGYASSPNTSVNIGLDIFSPQSKLGFLINPTYNSQRFAVQQTGAALRDSISLRNLEIPAYLKLRLGNVLSASQFWLALGGGYSIPLSAEQNYYESDTNRFVGTIDDNEAFKPLPFLSTIIGYELNLGLGESSKKIVERDALRILFYLKANYDLGNRINQDFDFGNRTSVGNISTPDLQFLRISVGVNLLLRVSKAYELAGTIAKEALK